MIAQYVNINAFIRRITAIVLVSATLTATLSAPVSADVYRWVEADGTVNYGERAPNDREYTLVSRSAPSKPSSRIVDNNRNSQANALTNTAPRMAGGNPVPAQDNLSDRQRDMLNEIQAAETARLAAIDKMRKSNCETSKRALKSLQTRGRIRVRNEAGEETAMTDENRAERISQAQKSVVANCDSLS